MKKYNSPIIDIETIECESLMDVIQPSPFTKDYDNEENFDWNFGTKN